jgi:putative restriction endonuclease
MDADRERDLAIRQAAFRFLDELTLLHGDSLPWAALLRGFDYEGQRVPLLSQQGIFKPRVLRLPLSIRTAAVEPGEDRPYDDGLGADGTLVYRYRGTNPQFHQNVWLRESMRHEVPMVYLHGTVPGRYVAAWPVYVIGDNPDQLAFRVDVEASRSEIPAGETVGEEPIERRYAIRLTRQRLHQETFRDRVLKAYREQCAICTLRHVRLLDAAHIVPDADPLGEPRVSNGISLCKLHHGAYDARILGIRPDLVVEVKTTVLKERDGPMLLHGLQGAHGRRIHAPRSVAMKPSAEALAQRYEAFVRSA